MANTFVALATVTVGAGGTTAIDFTSIPNTYTDILIKYSLRSDQGVDYNYAYLTLNGVTSSSYTSRYLFADSNTAGSGSSSTTDMRGNITVGANSTGSTFSNGELYIPNYTSSNNKSVSMDAVSEKNGSTNVGLYLSAGLFTTSSAVSSVSIFPGSTFKFVQYSTATLYGIKNS